MSTADIRNYRKVDDQIITGGQPSEQQLKDAADEGVRTVINLGLLDPRYALGDEAGLVQSLGMQYHHIPVEWDHPTAGDFAAFEGVMDALPAEKTLIHCAANFRVTAFYSLYALKRRGWTEAQADAFRASVWEGSDYPIWEAFIRDMKRQMSAEGHK